MSFTRQCERIAVQAGSPHSFRHGHSSHALARRAWLPEVENSLGSATGASVSAGTRAERDLAGGLLVDGVQTPDRIGHAAFGPQLATMDICRQAARACKTRNLPMLAERRCARARAACPSLGAVGTARRG